MLKEFFHEDTSSSGMINEAFFVGSTLYTIAIQYMAARAVFCNPQQYACVLPMTTTSAKAFNENASVKANFSLQMFSLTTQDSHHLSTVLLLLLAELESSESEFS